MPRKTKRQLELEQLIADTHVLPDSWRYRGVGYNTFIIDNYHSVDPEDTIIERLDRESEGLLPEEAPDQYSELHEYMDRLPKKLRSIVWEHYFEGKTFQNIGDKRGYSRQNAHEQLQKALKMMKEMKEN